MRRPAVRAGWLTLLLLLLPAPPLAAEDTAATAERFQSNMQRLRTSYLKKERFKKGLEQLRKLLQKHARKDYVRAHRAEVEDLSERLAFGAKYPPPDPAKVVSGRLERYDPETGYLRVTYTPKTMRDLQVKNGLIWFPGKIRGPFMLEVRGRKYPANTDNAPVMVFGGEKHPKTGKVQMWDILFGTPPRMVGTTEVWLPARITYRNGTSSKRGKSVRRTAAKIGKAYGLHLRATDSQIQAAVGGRNFATTAKPKGVWGIVGFRSLAWTRMTFTGSIEPAWIQDRLDKVVLLQLRDFKKTYSHEKALPAWLYEGPKRQKPKRRRTVEELPTELPKAHWRTVDRYDSCLKKGDLLGALEAVGKLEKAGGLDPIVAYLRAQVSYEAGRPEAALTDVDRALAVAPSFLDGLLLKGRMLSELGRADEAITAFDAATEHHKGEARAYETAAFAMLSASRPDAAERISHLALRNGISTEQLDILSRALVMVRFGPTWSRIFEYKSRNYHVMSDISKRTCVRASKLLEQAHTSYRVNFQWVKHEKNKLYKVYLFSGQYGYMKYIADLRGLLGRPNERSAGVYTSLLKQLLIWNLPNRDEMLETIRHEGFHQYLDRVMTRPPTWFNEGLAVYHENAEDYRGKLRFGKVHDYYLKALAKSGLYPLTDFIYQSHTDFYKYAPRTYGQAWALIHMMRHGKTKYRKLYKALVDDFQTLPPNDALARHFTPEVLAALDKDLKAYVAKLPGKRK